MIRKMRQGTSVVCMIAMAVTTNGCLPHVDEQVTHTPHAAGEPIKSVETRAADPAITAKASGNLVAVTVVDRKECRDILRTPMERVDETKRVLSNETIAQAVNLVGALGLTAGGVALMASPVSSCTKDGSSQSASASSSRPCTTSEVDDLNQNRSIGGGVLVAAGVVAGGLFVWNILRAKDTRTTAPLEAKQEESGWQTCSTQPLANASVVLLAGGVKISGTTNDRGEVALDVSTIASAPLDRNPEMSELTVWDSTGKRHSSSVGLADSVAYGTWKKAALEAVNSKKEEDAARTARRDRERADCADGNAESCYAIRNFRRACELQSRDGCVALQEQIDAETQERDAAANAVLQEGFRICQAMNTRCTPCQAVCMHQMYHNLAGVDCASKCS